MSHDEVVLNEIKWIKDTLSKAIKWAITIIVTLSTIGIGAIYAAGQHDQSFKSHEHLDNFKHEQLDAKIIDLKGELKEILELRIRDSLGDIGAAEQLEEMREHQEKKHPPIYATIGGEEV